MTLARKIGSFTVSATQTTVSTVDVKTVIRRSAEWNEYIVTLHINGVYAPEEDYHTADRDDAIRTSRTMARHAAMQIETSE